MADAWLTLLVFLHVLGAAAWVGGMLTLGAATGALRRALPEETRRPVLRAMARRAQPVLWTGLALAAISGLVLLQARGFGWGALSRGLPMVKTVLTLLAAAGGLLHVVAARRRMAPWLTAAGAALALLAGLGLLWAGAALRWT